MKLKGEADFFARYWAGGLLLLLAATWQLWLPSNGVLAVPLVDGVQRLPLAARLLPTVGVVAATCWAMWGGAGARWAWWGVAISLGAAWLDNQHRLQPWAYQSFLYAMVFASLDPAQGKTWLRPLAASIYIYSAAGKFDYQFVHTVGQDFLAAACGGWGDVRELWSPATRVKLAFGFPAIELVVGVMLLVPRLRVPAGYLAMMLHLSLILLLGPWGLDHSWGVLAWNAVLVGQAWLLFVVPERLAGAPADPEPVAKSWGSWVAKLAVVIALAAPLGERAGYWDHWLSWALYSPHSSRVEIEIHATAVARLPEPISQALMNDSDGDSWHRLALDRWSLDELGVPIYPQARFQRAVAERLASQYQLGDAIRGIIRGPSDRWTGQRQEQWFLGR